MGFIPGNLFHKKKNPNSENKQKNIKSMLLQMCIKSYVVKATLLGFFVLFCFSYMNCTAMVFFSL